MHQAGAPSRFTKPVRRVSCKGPIVNLNVCRSQTLELTTTGQAMPTDVGIACPAVAPVPRTPPNPFPVASLPECKMRRYNSTKIGMWYYRNLQYVKHNLATGRRELSNGPALIHQLACPTTNNRWSLSVGSLLMGWGWLAIDRSVGELVVKLLITKVVGRPKVVSLSARWPTKNQAECR